jgi:nucleotide-binding universal stress UspA family protein
MYPFKRLLVGLDLSGREESTVQYAAMAAKMTKPRRIYFCHVASKSEILDEVILQRHPELADCMDQDIIIEEMKNLVAESFEDLPDTKLHYQVVSDSPLRGLVRAAIDEDIDLMIVGSKGTNRVLPEKLARNAFCSILIVPHGASADVSRILVPLDYSDLSAEAMKVAMSCYRVGEAEYMQCQHAYRVPFGYHKLGKTREEFAGIMKEHAESDYEEFIKEFDLEGINLKTDFRLDHDVSKAVAKAVDESGITIIIVGARGRTGSASLLLGSVTEKVIRKTSIPVLAVKKKGANLGFLQALFEL